LKAAYPGLLFRIAQTMGLVGTEDARRKPILTCLPFIFSQPCRYRLTERFFSKIKYFL